MAERIVEVEWEDAAYVSGWCTDDELTGPDPISSVGYLYRDDEVGIVLVQGLNNAKESPRAQLLKFFAPITIPRAAIRKVTELRPKGRK